ncbi:MAG: hypothetical protein ACXVHT_10340, partial [Methanobacterium sp.]
MMVRIEQLMAISREKVNSVKASNVKANSSYLKVDPQNLPKRSDEREYAVKLIKSRHGVIPLNMNEDGEVLMAIQTSKEPPQKELEGCVAKLDDSKYSVFVLLELGFFLDMLPGDNNPSGNLSYEIRKEKLQGIKDFAAANEKPAKILYYDVNLSKIGSRDQEIVDVLADNYMKEKKMCETDFQLKGFWQGEIFKKCIHVNKKMSDFVDEEFSENLLDCGSCKVEFLTKVAEFKLPDAVFEAMHEELLDNNLEN